jgi:hypothetical protein
LTTDDTPSSNYTYFIVRSFSSFSSSSFPSLPSLRHASLLPCPDLLPPATNTRIITCTTRAATTVSYPLAVLLVHVPYPPPPVHACVAHRQKDNYPRTCTCICTCTCGSSTRNATHLHLRPPPLRAAEQSHRRHLLSTSTSTTITTPQGQPSQDLIDCLSVCNPGPSPPAHHPSHTCTLHQ